ncbi:helix-turn-helix protein [Trichococcus patagoniensis]|uniref:Helix-turn-helix protein n=1 Tax=Trichococcus patagoniensis TaxID=382641 RepID=A0A2T5IJ17_9LACT|nr:helix-turn-helix transcriptional regulator [Trichococcus patagoniensis]PTQ83808.1 helix-turn-helix protein [Trichococcus patagoniensis]
MANFFEKYTQIVGQDKVSDILREGELIGQIKSRRKEKKMSQADLAKLIEVPKSTIGRIEAGLTSPRTDTLLKISRALDIALVIDGRERQNDLSEK